jgi:hypothetical protein
MLTPTVATHLTDRQFDEPKPIASRPMNSRLLMTSAASKDMEKLLSVDRYMAKKAARFPGRLLKFAKRQP